MNRPIKAVFLYPDGGGRMKKCNKDCFNCLYPDCVLKEYNTDRQRWCNRSEEYRKQQLEKKKEQYDSRKAAGLCVHCGKKATHGVRCYEHYLRNRRYNHEHRGTKRDTWQYLRKCYFCGKDVVPGKKTCAEHYRLFAACGKRMSQSEGGRKAQKAFVNIGRYKRSSE